MHPKMAPYQRSIYLHLELNLFVSQASLTKQCHKNKRLINIFFFSIGMLSRQPELSGTM